MAAGTPVYMGGAAGQNAYVPSHETTQGLIVDYSRNPADFALNQYIKLFPVDKTDGYYARYGRDGGLPEQAGRITDTTLSDSRWADGEARTVRDDGSELFQYVQHACVRYDETDKVGDMLAAQASFDVTDGKQRVMAQRQMTKRTQQAVTLLTTTANHLTGHFSAVSSISGNTGKWDVSTESRMDIMRSIDTAYEKIRQDTLGLVKRSDLVLVMSPNCAARVRRSQEMVTYIKNYDGARAFARGQDGFGPNAGDYSNDFPGYLYGVKVVIEDAVKVTSARGATRVAAGVLGDDVAFLVSRPGRLVGENAMAPNFAAASLFVWKQEEMAAASYHEPWNERTLLGLKDTRQFQLTAPAAAYLFTAATG